MAASLTLPVGPRDHIRGPESAPVTLVEYGDFECPQCAAAYPIVTRILDTFGDRLRFVFRHFPLTNSHPHAQHAAEAAEVAAQGGVFWPMYDALYAERAKLSDRTILECAAAAGVSSVEIERAWASHEHARPHQGRLRERHQERRHRHAVLLHQRRPPRSRLGRARARARDRSGASLAARSGPLAPRSGGADRGLGRGVFAR